jgi:Zn-dependent metalloprotease
MVLTFLTRYRQLFKLREPMQEFVMTSISSDPLGFTHVRLQQQFAGIVVWGSELIAHINQEQHVYLIQGRYIPTPEEVQTSPVLTKDDALRVAAQALDRTPSECPKCEATLMIFAAADQPPRLSYRVEASTSLTERWALMIDAINGAVLEQRTLISNPGPVLKRQ